MNGVQLRGDTLTAATTTLHAAGSSFANAGQLSAVADYGSGSVQASANHFVSLVTKATGTAAANAGTGSVWAARTLTSFQGLDQSLAAAVSA